MSSPAKKRKLEAGDKGDEEKGEIKTPRMVWCVNDADDADEGDDETDGEDTEYRRTESGPVSSRELAVAWQGLCGLNSHSLRDGRDIGELKSHQQAMHLLYLCWRSRSLEESVETKNKPKPPCRKCKAPAATKSIEAPAYDPLQPQVTETYLCLECYLDAKAKDKHGWMREIPFIPFV